MSNRRAPMTVDLDCERCDGTGWVTWRDRVPPELVRFGGGPQPGPRRMGLCSCVRPDTGEDGQP